MPPLFLRSNSLRIEELKKKIGNSVDSGAGFLIEENYDDGHQAKRLKQSEAQGSRLSEITECELCHTEFDESFLKKHFDYSVCDSCR